MDHVPAELVRKVLEYLLGQELLFALTSKSNLTHVRSLRKDRILPLQHRSEYLRSGELTAYMLAHDMTSADSDLMSIAAAHGCLDGMMVLRATEPPCPWDYQTCEDAAEGGHLHVLQWLRSQDPPCPWDEETCRCATSCASSSAETFNNISRSVGVSGV